MRCIFPDLYVAVRTIVFILMLSLENYNCEPYTVIKYHLSRRLGAIWERERERSFCCIRCIEIKTAFGNFMMLRFTYMKCIYERGNALEIPFSLKCFIVIWKSLFKSFRRKFISIKSIIRKWEHLFFHINWSWQNIGN